MKKLLLLSILLVIAVINAAWSQRYVSRIPGGPGRIFESEALGEDLLISNNPFINVYNGEVTSRLRLPLRDGEQLVLDHPWPSSDGIETLSRRAYLSLRKTTDILGLQYYLYTFRDGVFTPFALPDDARAVSNFVKYKNHLYILGASRGTLNLYQISDGVISTVSGFEFSEPEEVWFKQLIATESYLYLYCPDRFLIQYDGDSFFSYDLFYPIPEFNTGSLVIDQIVEIPDTEKLFVKVTTHSVAAYEGNAFIGYVSYPWEYEPDGVFMSRLQRHKNEVYYVARDRGGNTSLYAFDGSMVERLELPEGSVPLNRPVIHNDNFQNSVVVPAKRSDGSCVVYQYNESGFHHFFTYPTPLESPKLYQRLDAMLVLAGDVVFETDGITTTTIRGSFGEQFNRPLKGPSCYFVWELQTPEGQYAGREDRSDCRVSIIPDALRNHEQVSIQAWARERDWCWSDIFVDWVVNPICMLPPYCSDVAFKSSLLSAKGELMWEFKTTKPGSATVPLKDNEDYRLVVGASSPDDYKTFLILDEGLVKGGMESVTINISAKEERVSLTAKTDKGTSIPIAVSLENADGKTLWTAQLTAPFEHTLNAIVSESVSAIRLSPLQKEKQTSFSFYPNPVKNQINIEQKNAGTSPTTLRVYSMQGELVLEKTLSAQEKHQIDMTGMKAGLYIVELKTEETTLRKRVEMR